MATKAETVPTERERIERAMAMLRDLPAVDVMATADAAADYAQFWTSVRNRARYEMLRRMVEGEVSEIADGDFKATKTAGAASYKWDGLALELEVKPLLVGNEWNELVEITDIPARRAFKVNTAKMHNLAKKRGGALKEAVEASRTVTAGVDGVTIERVS